MFKKQFILLFALLSLIVLGESCGYKKRNTLFKTKKEIKTKEAVLVVNKKDTSTQIYRHRIKVGDRLIIRFLNNYDIGGAASKSATSSADAAGDKGYLVNYDSTVVLPLIGRINLIGLTRLEAAKRLEQEYGKLVIAPIIDVDIKSLGVIVLGEVLSQGKVLLDKERTTIAEVIALSGGIKETGKKKNIRIIRGEEIIIIDLMQIEALQFPEVVMHDGDIVYVEPYNVKSASEPAVAITPLATLLITSISTLLLVTNFIVVYRTLQ